MGLRGANAVGETRLDTQLLGQFPHSVTEALPDRCKAGNTKLLGLINMIDEAALSVLEPQQQVENVQAKQFDRQGVVFDLPCYSGMSDEGFARLLENHDLAVMNKPWHSCFSVSKHYIRCTKRRQSIGRRIVFRCR